MREVAVLGVGMTKFGPSSLSLQELFAEAALEAIRESNLTSKDIQAWSSAMSWAISPKAR